MRERLRRIADEAASLGIILLREQADIVRESDQSLEQGVRFVVSSLQCIRICQPE